jgi:hypothetical protein
MGGGKTMEIPCACSIETGTAITSPKNITPKNNLFILPPPFLSITDAKVLPSAAIIPPI